MDEFVLELMRRRVVEDLIAVVKLKANYVVKTGDWKSALKKHQAGAFLWLGKEAAEESQEIIEGDKVVDSIPQEFATLVLGQTKKRKVPVHNMLLLLGEKHLQELRMSHPLFTGNEILAIRNRKRTIDLQLRLWKLQGYLAKHSTAPAEQDT